MMIGEGATYQSVKFKFIEFKNTTPPILVDERELESIILVVTGPHIASFLKVHSFCMSSKKRVEGHRLRNGVPSTH